jgi:prefoldin subunit 5
MINTNKEMQLTNEIQRLKAEIEEQRERISSIKELVNEEIHRDFHLNLEDLSGKELDSEMGVHLARLDEDSDPRPDPQALTSHRQVIGKAIVFLKRLMLKIASVYTNTLLEKQNRFNHCSAALHHSFFIRFRHMEKRIRRIEEKLGDLEEHEVLIADKLEGVQRSLTELREEYNHDPQAGGRNQPGKDSPLP